jgi:hypothetical protein
MYAVEEAGLKVRDQLLRLNGSAMPRSAEMGKAIGSHLDAKWKAASDKTGSAFRRARRIAL